MWTKNGYYDFYVWLGFLYSKILYFRASFFLSEFTFLICLNDFVQSSI